MYFTAGQLPAATWCITGLAQGLTAALGDAVVRVKDTVFTSALHLKKPWLRLAMGSRQLLVFPDEKLQ